MKKPSDRRVQANPFTRREIEEAIEKWFLVCQMRRDRKLLSRIVSRDLAGWPSGDDGPAFLDSGKDPDEDQPNALSELGSIITHHFWLGDTSLTEDELYSLLEGTDVLELGWRHAAWDTFSSLDTPLYSLKEHSTLISRLCNLLECFRQTHIETGMPPVLGGFPRQLEPLLRLYYTRIPKEARLSDKILAGNGNSLTRRSLRNPLGEPEVIDRMHGTAIEYKWPVGNSCNGDLIKLQGFDLHDIVKLEEVRPVFYELKTEVLQTLWAELQRDRPRSLWVRCLPAFKEHMLYSTFQHLLKMDAVYLFYNFPENPLGRLFPILFNADEKVSIRTMMTSNGKEVTMGNEAVWEQCTAGGLLDLIELICFYDFESKVGGWTKARDNLESLVVDSHASCLPILYGACKSNRRVKIDDYRDLILGEKGRQLCDAYRELCETLPKWKAFREEFMETVRKDLELGLSVTLPLRLRRGLYLENKREIREDLRHFERFIKDQYSEPKANSHEEPVINEEIRQKEFEEKSQSEGASENLPVIEINRRTNWIIVDGKNRTDFPSKSGCHGPSQIIQALTFAFEQCRHNLKVGKGANFSRKELVAYLRMRDKTKRICKIFPHPCLWNTKNPHALVKKGDVPDIYHLAIDFKKSKVDYEPGGRPPAFP